MSEAGVSSYVKRPAATLLFTSEVEAVSHSPQRGRAPDRYTGGAARVGVCAEVPELASGERVRETARAAAGIRDASEANRRSNRKAQRKRWPSPSPARSATQKRRRCTQHIAAREDKSAEALVQETEQQCFSTALCQPSTSRLDETRDVKDYLKTDNTQVSTEEGQSINLLSLQHLVSSLERFTESLRRKEQSAESPAGVWIPQAADGNVTEHVTLNAVKSKGIPEMCYKEALPCEMSPLGFHLSTAVKEKIWKCEYLDLISLLPSVEESVNIKDKKSDEQSLDLRRRSLPRLFNNWLQGFCIFAAVWDEKSPEHCSGLFQHLENVLKSI